ncbi:hypothetical protein [Akkermansia sp.]|uniref:hypothetical protein n=1 Tax=Akkermansia sp. TaxID=1872421 RepID=UPI0025BAE6C6|nr:hypothetical protein [Akkermansia sp.]MCD8064560.1 hypothetical protein [Akkermansia sp.]
MWRLNHLYWIINKDGLMQRFQLNWAQQKLHQELWYRNDILKARQLGISTYVAMLMLDMSLFRSNFHCGIIDKSLVDGTGKISKIDLAYKSLDYAPDNPTEEDIALAELGRFIKGEIQVKSSKTTISFSNGSRITAGTSLRGGTFQFLHVSELGYVAAHAPLRAREIVTGAMNAVSKDGVIIRESTHEGGKFGLNYEMTKASMEMVGKPLSSLDWKFFFFPWWKNPEYTLEPGERKEEHFQEDLQKYFEDLKLRCGITLRYDQKLWYASQAKTFGGLVRQEYPSTPEEAFQALVEGSIYGSHLDSLRSQGRLCAEFEKDDLAPYYVSWDIGMADYMCLWLWQVRGDGKFYVMDCLQANDKPLEWYINFIRKEWDVEFGPIYKHLLPHDAGRRDPHGISFDAHLRRAGFRVSVVPRTPDVWAGIFSVRRLLNHCIFHERCSRPLKIDGVEYMSGVNALENYQKAPSGAHGVERDTPLHNRCSHAADGFRTFAEAYEKGLVGKTGAVAMPAQAVETHQTQGLAKGADALSF